MSVCPSVCLCHSPVEAIIPEWNFMWAKAYWDLLNESTVAVISLIEAVVSLSDRQPTIGIYHQVNWDTQVHLLATTVKIPAQIIIQRPKLSTECKCLSPWIQVLQYVIQLSDITFLSHLPLEYFHFVAKESKEFPPQLKRGKSGIISKQHL